MSVFTNFLGRSKTYPTSIQEAIFLDVGSTTLRLARGKNILWHEPSCIAVHTKTGQVVAFGTKAYNLLGKTGEQVKIIFPFQYGVVADRVAFEQLLQTVLPVVQKNGFVDSLMESILGKQGKYAQLSTSSPIEASVFADCLQQAGLSRLEACDQFKAAAAVLKLSERPEHSFCLIDIGGQVTEIAIMTGGSVITAQRIRWGGVQFTERVQEFILQKSECAVSWHTAELVKRQLAQVSADGTFTKHKVSIRGKHLMTQLGKTVVISNEELVPLCSELAEELVRAIQQLFSQAPTEVVTSCLEQGVHLFGGGAQLTGLPSFLSAQLQAEVSLAHQPELVVLTGLAKANE